jgi:cob(I)alamin adenosyltransferase
MVNLTRIYTKTGDDGTTALGDMSRTSKNDPRLEAYATVDEANSSIGVVLSTDNLSEDMRILLVRIQNDLFDVGADLCTPVVDKIQLMPITQISNH